MKQFKNLLLCVWLMILIAACVGNPGSEETPGGDTGEILALNVSATYIINNGTDAALFTVLKGKKDVTADARIYQKKGNSFEQLPGTSFSSTKQGTYSFFASYNGEMSEDITVTVTSGLLELPEDPNPEQFNGFKHRILALQGTSLGCTYCPMMIAGLTEYTQLEESESTVLVAAHGVMDGDEMISDYSNAVLKSSGISSKGVPALLFNLRSNREILSVMASDTPAKVASRIQATAKPLLATPAYTGISAAVSGTESSGSIKVTAGIKVGQTGKYRVCAWVVEDDIYATGQMNGYPTLEDSYDFTRHSNVLRCISSMSPITGTNLGGKDECQAGEEQMFFHEFMLSDMEIKRLSNVRVVIIVTHNESGSSYTVDNVVSCALNQQVKYEYQ